MRLILYVLFFILLSSQSFSAVITTITINEKDGVTTTNYPLTFAIPFKKGAVNGNVVAKINGDPISTQLDKKRSWTDGSLKHGVLTVIIPSIPSNGSVTVTLETDATIIPGSPMDKAAILATDVESVIAMANMSGSGNPATASASLRTAISEGNLNYWLQGPVCTEILEDAQITSNDNLHARWEARFYPGTAFGIRISNIVESTNIMATGGSTYDVTINQGNASPSQVFSYPAFSQGHGSRWRRTFWLGPEPPEVEIHYDLDYLSSTGMLPYMNKEVIPTETTIAMLESVNNTYTSYRGGANINGSGNLYKGFSQTGGRDDLGLFPTWVAGWLTSWNNRLKTVSLVTANAIGHCTNVHFREGDATKAFYGKAGISIDSRPTITVMDRIAGFPTLIGSAVTNGWGPDRAHTSGPVYVPYLLTGEHYYKEELQFWASMAIAWHAYGRQGQGSRQDFSSQFPQGTASGIIYDQERGIAWSLRNINDAAVISPDSDSDLIAYYKDKIANNVKWLDLGNSSTTGHSLGLLRGTRETVLTDPAGYSYFVAPWMHNFLVIVLSDIIRKEEGVLDIVTAKRVRDRFGSFTIGTVTNQPALSPFDGVALYYVPTSKKDKVSYTWTWTEFQQAYKDVSDLNTQIGKQGSIATVMNPTQIGDGEQRFYVTKAALADLNHLPGWAAANSFMDSYASLTAMKTKPQWGGLISSAIAGIYPDTCATDSSLCGTDTDCTANWPSYHWCANTCQPTACLTMPSILPWAISGRSIAPSGRPIAQ